MAPKINAKKCFLSSFVVVGCVLLAADFVGFSNIKDYIIPNNYGQAKTEPETINKGSIERLNFQNINNRVFLLEPFRDAQSRELHILTEAERHNNSEISQMKCVLCKNECSFYDDPDECIELKIEKTYGSRMKPPLLGVTFFHCLIPAHVETKDYPLSTLKIGRQYGHLAQISDINHKEANDTIITMCAGPQYGKSKKAINLAEWIEFHRLMGVDRFQIYVTDKNSVSNEYHELLKKYIKEGIVDLIYWESLSQSHYYSQNSLLNHCVWRNKAKSKFVVYNDIDEFFVPANNSYNNWNEAFSSYLENTNNSEIRFRNRFYDASCPDKKENPDLMLSSVFIRKKEPGPNASRTKCILRPERILWAGVHKTHRFVPEHKKNNYKVAIIPPKVGYMAHFKTKKIKTPECDLQKGKDVEMNKDLQKYGKMIEGKVNEIMTDLAKIAKTNTSQ